MSTYIELEIQNLLKDYSDLSVVADRLISILESEAEYSTSENISSVFKFLINSNLPQKVLRFAINNLESTNIQIPWAYLLEALGVYRDLIDEDTAAAILKGIQEQAAEMDASRTNELDGIIPQMKEWRSQRRLKIQQEFLKQKKNLLDELVTLRTQRLVQEEKNLLKKLQRLYPGDQEIEKELQEHKQRYALEILQKYSPKNKNPRFDDLRQLDPEVEKIKNILMQSIQAIAEKEPDLVTDLAVASAMLESYSTAIELLENSENSPTNLWLRAELLLNNRKFLDLLAEVTRIELHFSNDPETFFATAYFRAQALWGLGQKELAREVLESVISARPQYRAAAALLNIWSAQ